MEVKREAEIKRQKDIMMQNMEVEKRKAIE